MSKFYLPDLGEGLQGAEIVEWKVKEGDKVELDQLILVVETAKAIVEIPSPVDAVINRLYFAEGDSVEVGAALMEYGVASKSTTPTNKDSKSKKKSVSVVGSLPSSGQDAVDDQIIEDDLNTDEQSATHRRQSTVAPPVIQLFAERLGVSDKLSEQTYSEMNESHLLNIVNPKHSDDSVGDDNSVLALKGARKVMAQAMSRSHQLIPAVTLFDDADISGWEQGEDITIRCIEAIVKASRVEPILNAWFDEEAMSIQLFEDINLGVAVNADEGLFVPVIRRAQSLSAERIRDILKKQITSINNRTIKPQKLLGATISLSNFGTLCGRYATPIIVPPQVAIVGVGSIREEAIVRSGQIKVGKVMPISLSFDHRAATGAEAARFMKAFIDSLQA